VTTLPYPAQMDAEAARREGDVTAAEQDADAVFALVYRHMRALAAGREADLDDLVQAASEQALKSLSTFGGRAALSTWVYRVCYLTLLKHHRSVRRWLRRFRLTADGQLPDAPAPGPRADDALRERELALRLRAALARVSPKRRAVVVLHDLERLGVDEIATIVGAKEGTVRSRLRDGRKDLAAVLRRDPYFGDDARAARNEVKR
jgi:RNA polymerase sigma-70 factor, ECF subfamily